MMSNDKMDVVVSRTVVTCADQGELGHKSNPLPLPQPTRTTHLSYSFRTLSCLTHDFVELTRRSLVRLMVSLLLGSF
jgi:hypothetical protein